jgi:hypothetical protein
MQALLSMASLKARSSSRMLATLLFMWHQVRFGECKEQCNSNELF